MSSTDPGVFLLGSLEKTAIQFSGKCNVLNLVVLIEILENYNIKDPSRSQECPLSYLGRHGVDWAHPDKLRG